MFVSPVAAYVSTPKQGESWIRELLRLLARTLCAHNQVPKLRTPVIRLISTIGR
jgi:hypothetical protein